MEFVLRDMDDFVCETVDFPATLLVHCYEIDKNQTITCNPVMLPTRNKGWYTAVENYDHHSWKPFTPSLTTANGMTLWAAPPQTLRRRHSWQIDPDNLFDSDNSDDTHFSRDSRGSEFYYHDRNVPIVRPRSPNNFQHDTDDQTTRIRKALIDSVHVPNKPGTWPDTVKNKKKKGM